MKTDGGKMKTRRGATSIFVTMFFIVVLIVIMIGFSRLMVTESSETSNNDLSQSAYDSALAGIEDAKIALLQYHQCLSSGYTAHSSNKCGNIIKAMQNGIAKKDCDTIKNVLGRATNADNNSTIIQETQQTTNGSAAVDMVQAYTCVTIEEELDDYRTSIGADSRTRIIPIRSDKLNGAGSTDDIKKIVINWYVPTASTIYMNNELLYHYNTAKKSAPVLGVSFFQSDQTVRLSELSTARTASNSNRAMLYLKPVSTGGTTAVAASVLANSADKNDNKPTKINCGPNIASLYGMEFHCRAVLEIPKTWHGGDRNEGASFILLSLPYGSPVTDISVSLLKGDNTQVRFTGVQASIDSTGRANEQYRRVETRVELVDTYFPYPEFEIQMNDSNSSVIKKSFYTTAANPNCWASEADGNTSNVHFTCNGYGDLNNASGF